MQQVSQKVKYLVFRYKKCYVKLMALIQENITYSQKMLNQRLFLDKASLILYRL
jgi:hypothetical protein